MMKIDCGNEILSYYQGKKSIISPHTQHHVGGITTGSGQAAHDNQS